MSVSRIAVSVTYETEGQNIIRDIAVDLKEDTDLVKFGQVLDVMLRSLEGPKHLTRCSNG